MNVVSAHYGTLMTGRPHEGVLFRQCHALAASNDVTFLFGRTTGDPAELFRYYGREPLDALHLVQLPILRRRRWPRLSWNAVFYRACLANVRTLAREDLADLLYLREPALAEYLMTWLGPDCPPVVFEIHNLDHLATDSPDLALTGSERYVFSNADALVSTTDSLAAIVTRLAHPSRPVLKLPHAADFVDVPAPQSISTVPRITYVGQLYPLQGVELVLEALVRLPHCELHLVGGPPRDVQRLRKLSAELGLSQRTVFHGHVPPASVSSFLAQADVLVLPARNAGRMPFVAHTKLYEYLAAGRPIVAADLPSVAEELSDGVDALLVPPDDPQALADAIRRLLDDPPLRESLSQAARLKARTFTWQVRTDRLVEVFRSVLP